MCRLLELAALPPTVTTARGTQNSQPQGNFNPNNVRDTATKWLDWKTLGPLVEGYKTLIEADVKADTKRLETYEAFVQGTTGTSRSLKTFAAARREYLLSY